MKTVFVLCCLISIICADHHIPSREEMLAARNHCFEELQVPDEYKAEINKFQYPDVEIVHKYVRCSSKRLGYWDDTDGFKVDKLVNSLESDRENGRVEILKCIDKNEQGSSLDEWAYRNYLCLTKSPVMSAIRNKVNPKN